MRSTLLACGAALAAVAACSGPRAHGGLACPPVDSRVGRCGR